jgi:hypothetical protein
MATTVELREQQQKAPEYDLVPVTPEVATVWLRLNKSNRPLRKATIARLAKMMEKGEFKDDHPDHIMFDEGGFLINGQHRLHAIIRSQTTHQMRVLRHVPREMAYHIDIGIRRTIEDSVWIADGEKVDRLGLKLLTRFAGGGWVATSGQLPYTREELIALYEKYQEPLSAVAKLFVEHKQGAARAAIRAAVVRAWVARTQDRKRIREFIVTLCTGRYTNPDEDSAAMVLRDWLLQNSGRRQVHEAQLYQVTNWAIGQFLERAKVAKVRVATGEQFRIPEDKIFEGIEKRLEKKKK